MMSLTVQKINCCGTVGLLLNLHRNLAAITERHAEAGSTETEPQNYFHYQTATTTTIAIVHHIYWVVLCSILLVAI